MASEIWYDHFMDILSEKYPRKAELAQSLMDLLCIEREAAYRRLRKDVAFTVPEILKIAAVWNISLDAIVGASSGQVPFLMRPFNYIAPKEEDMGFMEQRMQAVEQLHNAPEFECSEYMLVCNNLLRSLSAGFAILFKFNIFKWVYEYCNSCNQDLNLNMPFSQVLIPEEVHSKMTDYYQHMKYVANTSYVLDSMLFDYLVRDIQFFHSILLITDEEKALIKNEVHELLDYLMRVANTGCFPETKKRVQIYVSMLNIKANYSYFYDGKTEVCVIHAFNMYDLVTSTPEMLENFKIWMQKKKGTSTQISETNERSRIEFFAKQRQIVDKL